jgi:hypothetical protein
MQCRTPWVLARCLQPALQPCPTPLPRQQPPLCRAFAPADLEQSRPVIRRIVKVRCEVVGLDLAKSTAHSLRAGIATSAASGGASMMLIANHGSGGVTHHANSLRDEGQEAARQCRSCRSSWTSRRRVGTAVHQSSGVLDGHLGDHWLHETAEC